MAKRAREMAQKDGVKDREARRLERKARAEARAASGIVGPEIDDSPRPDLNLVDGEGGGDGGGGGDGDGTDATDAQDQPLPDSAG
ncbi:MAG TPA: hypothetical protein VM261_21005 [Kofleriaceae bacterium]|nr:hypothetical protein [Kofleriaceae bacterium]